MYYPNYPNYLGQNSNYNNYTAPQTPVYQPTPPQFMTNKIYVTSVDDALSRFANPNTITAYFLQDESAIFEVTTDIQGKKKVKIRTLTDREADRDEKEASSIEYITRSEFEDLRGKIDGILNEKKKKGGAIDESK